MHFQAASSRRIIGMGHTRVSRNYTPANRSTFAQFSGGMGDGMTLPLNGVAGDVTETMNARLPIRINSA